MVSGVVELLTKGSFIEEHAIVLEAHAIVLEEHAMDSCTCRNMYCESLGTVKKLKQKTVCLHGECASWRQGHVEKHEACTAVWAWSE
jgi:hypothetical protein